MDIAAWLRESGLERYEPVFRENEIDWEVLPELTESDLEKLGLPLGPRRKLVKLMALGEHREANGCFRRGNDLYEPERHRVYVRSYGEDPGLWCHGYAAWTNDWLGYRDQAVEQNRLAIEIARELPTPNMLAMVLSNSATLHQFRPVRARRPRPTAAEGFRRAPRRLASRGGGCCGEPVRGLAWAPPHAADRA